MEKSESGQGKIHLISLAAALDILGASVAVEVKGVTAETSPYVGRPVFRTSVMSIVRGHWTEDIFLYGYNSNVGVTGRGELVMTNDKGLERRLLPLAGAPVLLPIPE